MDDTLILPTFESVALAGTIASLSPEALDELAFGVIGFDRSTVVRTYNRHESVAAGLSPARVIGRPLFTDVAPCMNNGIIAQRFHDAWATNASLDATFDYVLTLRMRPVRVALRLVAPSDADLAHVLVRRVAA